MTSKAYTKEQVRDMFLHQCAGIAYYWATLPTMSAGETTPRTILDRCNGVVFSILNIFDGTSMGLPAIDLVLRPHPSDKKYHQDEGTEWFKSGEAFNEEEHLHSIYYNYALKDQPSSPYVKALMEVRSLVLASSWKHNGDDALSQGMDSGARHQVNVILNAIDRAISEAK